jgi:hypothetical protein
MRLTLRRELVVYTEIDKSVPPLTISGYFLFDARGNVNQIKEDKNLHWVTTAEELVENLQRSWEPDQ